MTHHPLSSFVQKSLTHYTQWRLTLRGGVKQLKIARNDRHDTSSPFVIHAKNLTHSTQWRIMLWGGVKQLETTRDNIHDTSSSVAVHVAKSHSLHTMAPHTKG
jgi:agmatine/peptidylarginine deiminase